MVAPKPKSGSACFLRSFMLTPARRRDARGGALAMGANGARALAPIGASGYTVRSEAMNHSSEIVGADKYLDGVVVERLLSSL